MKRKIALLLVAALGMSMFAGCGKKETNEQPTTQAVSERQDFVHGVYNLEKLDPGDNYNGWGCSRYGVGETLFALDDSLNTVPKLALDSKLSDDKLT